MPTLPRTVLLCPVCGSPLSGRQQETQRISQAGSRQLICRSGHQYDAARQGYFNLLTGAGTAFEADSPEMVQARIDFLERGHFAPLADAVSSAVQAAGAPSPLIMDAGAGTGYYLQSVRRRIPCSEAIALDISKFALRRAARAQPDVLCLVWDVWRALPVMNESVDALLNIFAPRNPREFGRVVKDGGVVVTVTPLPHHLQEIAGMADLLAIRPGKHDDVASSLANEFDEISAETVEFQMQLSSDDIANVAAMGPAGHHRLRPEPGTLPATQSVTAACTVQTFRRTPRISDLPAPG